MASVTANCRMSYAFSRDGALPGSRLWAKVNARTGTPTQPHLPFRPLLPVPAAPGAKKPLGLFGRTSIAVIGLYIAYVVPVFLRRRNPAFRTGDWHLGRWSAAIGWIAVGWVIFIVILFMLPAYAPGTGDTFNYAPVAVLAVLLLATGSWFLRGHHHFMRDVPEGHDTRSADEIFYE